MKQNCIENSGIIIHFFKIVSLALPTIANGLDNGDNALFLLI